jgi:probable phosphoglycerate mutase
MTQTIYLIRHATPDWTRTDLLYHLPPGPPLTEQGQQEAQALGAFLLASGVRRFYSSPLERCVQTTQIAAGMANSPWEIDQGLIELAPSESSESVLQRVKRVFERACQHSLEAGPVALITHGGTVNVLLPDLGLDAQALAQHKKVFDHANPLPPAGAWLAERQDGQATWELRLAFKPNGIYTTL